MDGHRFKGVLKNKETVMRSFEKNTPLSKENKNI